MEQQWFDAVECLGERIDYYILPEGAKGYGVGAAYREEVVFVRNITPCLEEITALASLLRQGRVTPVALRDVVEDWLLR